MVTAAGPLPHQRTQDDGSWSTPGWRRTLVSSRGHGWWRTTARIPGSTLVEQTNQFRVRAVVPMEGVPPTARSCAGIPRPRARQRRKAPGTGTPGSASSTRFGTGTRAYWETMAGAPQGVHQCRAGQRIWGNRFGDFTAIRWFLSPGSRSRPRPAADYRGHPLPPEGPADLGMVWQPVAKWPGRCLPPPVRTLERLLHPDSSFSLIVASLLTASMLLFQFALDLRLQETGILLALGWPQRVRRVLFRRDSGGRSERWPGPFWACLCARNPLGLERPLWSQAVAGNPGPGCPCRNGSRRTSARCW